MLNITNASIDDDGNIWAGGPGGIFIFSSIDNDFRFVRNTDGLLSQRITAMKFDQSRGYIITGSIEGYIELIKANTYNSAYLEILHITDIYNQKFTNARINDIVIHDTLAYIAGGFGIAVLDLNRNVFLETVEILGTFPKNINVNKLSIIDDYLWACTEEGLAKCQIHSYKRDPSVWSNYTRANGIPQKEVKFAIKYKDSLYIATDHEISVLRADDLFYPVRIYQDYERINSLEIFKGELLVSNPFAVLNFENSNALEFDRKSSIQGISLFIDGVTEKLIAFYSNDGIEIYENGSDNIKLKPNSPYSNKFTHLSISETGVLWVGTGREGGGISGEGAMIFDSQNNEWTNINRESFSVINSNSFWKASPISDSRGIICNWGSGVTIVDLSKENPIEAIYNQSNSPLTGISTDANYIVAGEAKTDRYGNLWITNFDPSPGSGPILVCLTPNGEFFSYNNRVSPSKRGFTHIEIDRNGTKWLGSTIAGSGIYYLNDNGTLGDISDDEFGVLTTANTRLLENNINALEIDKIGQLWIGTSQGLQALINTDFVFFDQNQAFITDPIREFRNIFVNDIMADAVNNLWIATNNGVFIQSANDISENLAILNSHNSPLIDNDVVALATDKSTGRIYFGTSIGMSSCYSLSIQPEDQYKITCYPQPFDPIEHGELVIDGLASDTDLRITTSSGNLVKSLKTTGRTAVWDGTTVNGELAGTGIFLIIATSGTTDASSVAKFVVVRRK